MILKKKYLFPSKVIPDISDAMILFIPKKGKLFMKKWLKEENNTCH